MLSIKSISGYQLLPTVLLGKCIDIYSDNQREQKDTCRVFVDNIKSVRV